eukprot:MONOS_12645.1-p1 / transcript=MONOS_12645.1 / gene=MONOS_12645 / organism=Monocercomonoides_exilis_PA203 / gene_product=unspecified product / transcript_product=unspecified product / location=Mono_scaffold00713:30509-31357(+) / protein_length=217 / sequence_SO=supercontig / SO=protein_coding / is_pseudo=false
MLEMIEEDKVSIYNAIWLLKYIMYYELTGDTSEIALRFSFLRDKFEKMIIDENEKKKEKDEKLLVDLCECYISTTNHISPDLTSICIPNLLKVALKKEENGKVRKEVEMALMALCNLEYLSIKKDLYLNEIKEIIEYHQEHCNLTQLAYQSAWQILISRLYSNGSLEKIIVSELHFARKATRELEESKRCIDWKRKEGEERGKEIEEEIVSLRWLH